MISDIEDIDETMMGSDLKPSTLEVFKLFKSNRPQVVKKTVVISPYNTL